MNSQDGWRRKMALFLGSYPTILDRVIVLVHSRVVGFSLRKFGSKSRIESPSRIMNPHLIEVGDQVRIGEHAWLNAMDWSRTNHPTLKIGDGAYIGRFCQINAWCSVQIGPNALIADRVFISDSAHETSAICEPIVTQGTKYGGSVTIGEGCWIGIGVTILPGVRIGKGAIIGANSVVTKDIPDYAVAYGVPAKVKRMRDSK